MALGGGVFTTQNKILPGTYINFVSAATASSALSERGICTMPLELNWGKDNAVFAVEQSEFLRYSMKLFGYAYDAPELKGLRDLFLNAKKVLCYKLTSGGVKASNTFGTAICCGTRGNSLQVVISESLEDENDFVVDLYMDDELLDSQTVASASELVDNDWFVWDKTATLAVTAGTACTGGTNGTVSGTSHQAYLNAIESYSFNTMGVVTTDSTTKAMYAAFVERMRDTVGKKFQCVLYNQAADYEGVINVMNATSDTGWSEASAIYWVVGAEAACPVNSSCTNKKYNGEFTIGVSYTQAQLEEAILAGKFAFHDVGGEVHVLIDNDSLTTTTASKNELFKSNQSIRVIDQIANDIATLFNTKYIGQIPNDAAGRTSLWADIVKHHRELEDIRAIENFSDSDVIVTPGESKRAVTVSDAVTIVNCMEQLYMVVQVA